MSDNGSEYINHNEFKLDADDSITKKKLGGEIMVSNRLTTQDNTGHNDFEIFPNKKLSDSDIDINDGKNLIDGFSMDGDSNFG